MKINTLRALAVAAATLGATLAAPSVAHPQGVTTSGMTGIVTSEAGEPLVDATVTAVHVPSGTQYRGVVRDGGVYNLPNLRVGGPYTVTVRFIGYQPKTEPNVFLVLAQDLRLDFELVPQAIELAGIQVTGERDEILNADRTGAATFIGDEEIALLPSVKRSTRDLIRTDPRNDGNYAFAGRNWLFNNISLDGSYFNNPFGLDDPAPGGQTNAEPIPYDAVEQVQVSIAPFDIRQGGFTGANVNTVTRSGTNQFSGSVYTFFRNENFQGNEVSGQKVVANPDLSFLQSGVTLSGPIVQDKLFFFVNAEIERTDDPGTNFVAGAGGAPVFGESRVEASVMDRIQDVMMTQYGYDTGPYQGFVHETNNDKILFKLDWNVSENHNLWFRYNFLDAQRDLPPHPFVFSANNTGRGPNESSLPFQNSGYRINNELNSFALELNSRGARYANRFYVSYNRFRDFREPFSVPFPTLEIAEDGVTYTTVGHEPFSVNNILDQDVWQLTNNFTLFRGKHAITLGANFEHFGFFNSFNLFRHGVLFLDYNPTGFGGTTFQSLDDFFQYTDPTDPSYDPALAFDPDNFITPETAPFKGENVDVGQLGLYVQDEFTASDKVTLTLGLRVDFPMYFTDPVDNAWSRAQPALDPDDNPVTVDQSKLPGATPLFSPRFGFNWDVKGDRSTQVRGGTGVFTGRVPFVWVGNVISNPGFNELLWSPFNNPGVPQIPTKGGAILQQSFDLNAMVDDFKWPQVWTTDVAVDQQLPGGFLGTLELIYGKDLNAIVMWNGDLVEPVGTIPIDGRPYFGGGSAAELTSDNPDGPGDGIYVLDNTSDGYSVSVTGQLRKIFAFGLDASLSYSFTEAKNRLKSTEIASVLFSNQPTPGDPNRSPLTHSEFGQRHRIVGSAMYRKMWSRTATTQIGLFLEIGQGNRFAGAGGNRYSFIYAGDVNGDGFGGNDLIYVPRDQSEIVFAPFDPGTGTLITAQQQWDRFNAFIEQDDYLREHRGKIAERFGALNPWYQTIDLRILQDFAIDAGGNRHAFQFSLDVLNVANLLNDDWGVRKVATAAATSPLTFTDSFDASGNPIFNYTGPGAFGGTPETYVDDPGLLSRWRLQIGLRYLFN